MAIQTWMGRFVGVAVVGGAILVAAGTASAQHHHHHHPGGGNIGADFSRVVNDSNRLNRDFQQLNRDAAKGNIAGEINDLRRIVRDENRLSRDVNRLNYDVNSTGYYNTGYSQNGYSLIPSTSNPGYYYYSNNPGQLYYYPNQQTVQTQVAVPSAPQVTSVPVNPLPQVFETVRIINPASTGVELRFVFGGKEFSVASGDARDFQIAAPTLIVFSRGGQMGEARYTLSGGSAFEFKIDNSGWSMVTRSRETLVSRTDAGSLPSNPLPASVTPQPIPVASTR